MFHASHEMELRAVLAEVPAGEPSWAVPAWGCPAAEWPQHSCSAMTVLFVGALARREQMNQLHYL